MDFNVKWTMHDGQCRMQNEKMVSSKRYAVNGKLTHRHCEDCERIREAGRSNPAFTKQSSAMRRLDCFARRSATLLSVLAMTMRLFTAH